MKTAKILHFPTDFPREAKPKIPSTVAIVCTLRIDYWEDLTEGQRDIVHVAEQLAMKGEDSPSHYKAVHQIYVKVRTVTMLDKIMNFCRRFK